MGWGKGNEEGEYKGAGEEIVKGGDSEQVEWQAGDVQGIWCSHADSSCLKWLKPGSVWKKGEGINSYRSADVLGEHFEQQAAVGKTWLHLNTAHLAWVWESNTLKAAKLYTESVNRKIMFWFRITPWLIMRVKVWTHLLTLVVKCFPLIMLNEKKTVGAGWKEFERAGLMLQHQTEWLGPNNTAEQCRYWPLFPLSTFGVSCGVL